MRLLFVTNIAPRGAVTPLVMDAGTWGFKGYGFLYPDVRHAEVHAEDVGDLAAADVEADVIVFNPTSVLAGVHAMTEFARRLRDQDSRPRIVTLDCDPTGAWLYWYPRISLDIRELFALSDAVVTRVPRLLPALRAVSGAPAFYVPEVSTLVACGVASRPRPRDVVLVTQGVVHTHNSRRNGTCSLLAAAQVARDYPTFHFKQIANTYQMALAPDGSMTVDEDEVHRAYGIAGVEIVEDLSRNALLALLSRCRAVVNLDCEHAAGHWQMDAAACGVPAICTDSTAAGADLHADTLVDGWDIDAGARALRAVLNLQPDAWSVRSAALREAARRYGAEPIRAAWEEMLADA